MKKTFHDAYFGETLSKSTAFKLFNLLTKYKLADSTRQIIKEGAKSREAAQGIARFASEMDRIAHEVTELLISKIDSKNAAIFEDATKLLAVKASGKSPQDVCALAKVGLSEAQALVAESKGLPFKKLTYDEFRSHMRKHDPGITDQSISTIISTYNLDLERPKAPRKKASISKKYASEPVAHEGVKIDSIVKN